MLIKFLTLAALASATVVLGACAESTDSQSTAARPAARSVPVIAEPLAFEHARTKIESVGTSRAVLSADLYPAASGEVVAVNLEPDNS